jgi:hypothetical protein
MSLIDIYDLFSTFWLLFIFLCLNTVYNELKKFKRINNLCNLYLTNNIFFNNINVFRLIVIAENENITINKYKSLDYDNSSALFMHQVWLY